MPLNLSLSPVKVKVQKITVKDNAELYNNSHNFCSSNHVQYDMGVFL